MRRCSLLLPVPALVLVLACARPEVEAFRARPVPVVVRFEAPASLAERADVEKEYAAALRARLASRVTVVEEGVQPPAEHVVLDVRVTELRGARRDPSPAVVGAITGVAVGALSAMAGNRDAACDGFFWGLWAGVHAAEAREYRERLGYLPNQVSAQVALRQPGIEEPLAALAVEPREVFDAMDPLRGSEREDPSRIREEEARAVARVVVAKLQDAFGWTAKARGSWYGPERRELPPEPKPEPKADAQPAPKAEEPKPEAPKS